MFLLGCLVLVAATFNGIAAEDPEMLLGGTDVSILKHPHAVSIRIMDKHFCGGTIISSRHILTAAHCVQPFEGSTEILKLLTVVSGTHSLRFGGQKHQVAAMRYHPQYQGNPQFVTHHDVAVITLTKPMKFTDRQKPAKLPTSNVPELKKVVIGAWGATSFPKGQLSQNLQEIELNTIPHNECSELLRGSLTDTEFCTFLDEGCGTCEGDSGSGVMRGDTVVGCVSHGIPCALGIPDVQTNIYAVKPFIIETMNMPTNIFA